MSQKRYLVTAGLPYSNGRLHVGHIAGAYLPADTWVRFMRSRGEEIRFICGSDDNGVAALIAARNEGKTPEELTAHYNRLQAEAFGGLGIHFDIYGGTHQPGFVDLHNRLSGDFFKKIDEQGYFQKKTTQQLYDPEAKQFLPDRYVQGTCYHKMPDGSPCGYTKAYGDQCDNCGNMIDALKLIDPISKMTGARPEPRETVHWYLQLGRLEDQIRDWLESKREPGEGPAWREATLNFALGQIKGGLPERAMTRDLNWGVPVPLDDPDAEGKVLYVWFDAPIGYVSFTAKLCEERDGDAEAYTRWWKDPDTRIVHFIGEDNTIFHTITWPGMMMAEGSYQLPWQVVVNAFLNIQFPGKEAEKIGKSLGNAIWIQDYLETFDPDPMRYYLTRIAPESSRTAFNFEEFVQRNNGELVGTLGNFFQRTLTFTHKNFDAKVPAAGERAERDNAQLENVRWQVGVVANNLENFHFRAGLEELMRLADQANKYISEKAPWTQRKTDLAAAGTSINVCLQTARALTVAMAPFLPFTAEKAAAFLGLPDGPQPWSTAIEELPDGHPLGTLPTPLFRQIDAEELLGGAAAEKSAKG